MISFLTNKARPIGLDIGHDSIRMIQLAGSGEHIRVVAADKAPLQADMAADPQLWKEAVVSTIIDMLRRGNFQGRNVVSCLSNDSLKIMSLRLDTTDDDEMKELLRKDVAQRLGLDADTDEIRYLIAGNVYQGDEIKNEVIFFGTDRSNLASHIALLEQACLTPVAIDTVPCALFRSFQASLRRVEDQQLVSVFVDVGSRFTTVIIGRGQQITFVKQIPIAGDQLNREVASRLDIGIDEAIVLRSKLRNTDSEETIDPATKQTVIDAMSCVIEELATEVSRCFRYYAVTFRGERPKEVVFAGGEANEPALLDALKRHLSVDIKIAQPLRGFDLTRVNFNTSEQTQLSQWAVAVGLGIKGWELPDAGNEDYERN
jgi:type IV pilus assembly protein PilM